MHIEAPNISTGLLESIFSRQALYIFYDQIKAKQLNSFAKPSTMYLCECDHQNDNVCTQQMFEPNSTNNHQFLSPTENNVFQLPFLPSELIVEILLRLLARCLLKFRRVCKLWKTLISDPTFAKKHLLISIADPSMTHQRLAFHNCSYSLKKLFENPSVRVIPDRFNGLENDDQFKIIMF
jgi:hypothetical protein